MALAAPDAKIMPLRTLGPDGVGTIWMQVQALRYAISHGADVINLSYSFTNRSKVLDEVLAQATCTAASRNAISCCNDSLKRWRSNSSLISPARAAGPSSHSAPSAAAHQARAVPERVRPQHQQVHRHRFREQDERLSQHRLYSVATGPAPVKTTGKYYQSLLYTPPGKAP